MSERRPVNRPPQHPVERHQQPRPVQSRPTHSKQIQSNPSRTRTNPKRQPIRRQQSNRLLPMIIGAVLLITVVLILIFTLGGNSEKLRKGVDIVHGMASHINTMYNVVDHTAETDPNERLGDRGWYINKTDWCDTRTDGEYTLEVYTDEAKAKERAEYLETFYGTFICNYVVYRHNGYVLRVDDDLSETEFNQYKNALLHVLSLNDFEFTETAYSGLRAIYTLTTEDLDYHTPLTASQENIETVSPSLDNVNISSSTDSPKAEATISEMNALKSGRAYIDIMPMSRSGLIKQLLFEGYSNSDAEYAANNCGANWNEQAARSAKNYLDIMSFSRQGLVDQLIFDGFTKTQAEYGVKQNGYN